MVEEDLPEPEPEPEPEALHFGEIIKLNWGNGTGVIQDEDGTEYPFEYRCFETDALRREYEHRINKDLTPENAYVEFLLRSGTVTLVRKGRSLVRRALEVAADGSLRDRFIRAYGLCRRGVRIPAEQADALALLVEYACKSAPDTGGRERAGEAIEIYEQLQSIYPGKPLSLTNLARCYCALERFGEAFAIGDRALAAMDGDTPPREQTTLVYSYMSICLAAYEKEGKRAYLETLLEKYDVWMEIYRRCLSDDGVSGHYYRRCILPWRFNALCGLDRLEEARALYPTLEEKGRKKWNCDAILAKTEARLAPPAPAKPEDVPQAPEAAPAGVQEEPYQAPGEEEPGELPEEEILPYVDTDGWAALKLTKAQVVDYALSIGGDDRIPAVLAYLRAAASLCRDVLPVYRTLALAANDPMEGPDYSITALVEVLASCDTDYPELNDCCMAAAFLRTSFLAGRGYDYSAQGLRDSISLQTRLPALREAYDTLEQFRSETGQAMDIYADYRNQGVKKLQADMAGLVRRAGELDTKYIQTPPRESASFARILETRKLLFRRDGYLAMLLRILKNQDQAALEAEKAHFVETFLGGMDQFSVARIDPNAIDDLIVEAWEQAGRNMNIRKANATLQGDRRSNLRSNVTEIVSTACQWYALSAQSAGLNWRTGQGTDAYARLRPQLMRQLDRLHGDCMAELEASEELGLSSTGLFLLAVTAGELSARLDGSWKFGQEKYMYVDFLRTNHITLDGDFLPELRSTFCVLPEFNVLSRIRQHVEGPKRSFQERIDEIYGMEKTCNDYGTAERIVEYLEAMGEGEAVSLPDNGERFLAHTQMQVDMGYRDFRETYALAMSYGQIIKSDDFCYTLEDTVRYWYAFCRESKNYGFFTSILLQAKEQIHTSARVYEEQLDAQVDALIASNRQYFDAHPDYGEAIRAQVANQNFTVAEDWMARIRIGDFSLNVQQPEALGYLEGFWNSFPQTYSKVADASRSLSVLLNRREVALGRPTKDAKRALLLIDNWLGNGHPSNPDHIQQLLNLLGWQNIQVSQQPFAPDPRAEVYEVRSQAGVLGLTTPQHPIAAFGSSLEKKRMHVACLYGTYDCDRIFEKMRSLDVMDGSKIILLDYALGQTDRRALARKLKRRESGLRNVYMVIDRVLITHLANNYNENLINRILMAIAMPFSYCQPYVVDSAHTMPPEIFIGRKDELLKIEQPDGVNLIYGELGKSALFKKALADLDGRDGKRAVLVDIKELDCAGAARKLSTKLIDLGITPDGEITDDWDVLCRSIERRLRGGEEELPYFLLMLDEADAFINDCASCGYRPLVALKDVQQSLPGQFKYVLAGLHNIVKFNRQVALGNNSVITHMPSLKITPFRTPEAQELLTGPLSCLGFSLPSKVTVSQILATCNYFPGLIQLYAKKLIESIRDADYAGYDVKKTPPYVVSDEHLRRVMADKEFVDQIHEKFEITLTLDQDQGSCYYPLTLLIGWMYNVAPSKNGYTARDVLDQARDLAVYPLAELDVEKIDALLLELQDLNILRSVSNDSYLLSSKNFRDLLGSDDEIFDKLSKMGGAAL